jgi:simple sugar transport system permease protein
MSPLLALILTLLAGSILFRMMQVDVLGALYIFFIEPVSSRYGLAELGVKAIPLVLIGVALSLGFRAGVWNIGAEGQFIFGAIFGGGAALAFYEQQGFYILPLVLLAGIVGGMVWAGIVAWLRTQFNANEILTSLMLSYVAGLCLSFLVHGPWKDPDGYNFPESRIFSDSAILPIILEGTRLHVGVILVLIIVLLGWGLLARTRLGFQIKVVGDAPSAASYAGFSQNKTIWMTLLMSGGAAGLAGVMEVVGPIGQLLPSISPGYGFTAIIVAYVGRLHPVGALFAGLLIALSYLGGESAQISLNLPLAVGGVFQGMLLFFLLACDVLIHYQLRLAPSGK